MGPQFPSVFLLAGRSNRRHFRTFLLPRSMWRWHLDQVRGGKTQPHNERGEERELEGEVEIADPGDDVDPPVAGTYQTADYFPTSSGSFEPPTQRNLSSHSSLPTNHRYLCCTRKPLERLNANIEQ